MNSLNLDSKDLDFPCRAHHDKCTERYNALYEDVKRLAKLYYYSEKSEAGITLAYKYLKE